MKKSGMSALPARGKLLDELRALMATHSPPLQALLVLSEGEHVLGQRNRLRFISGFTGSEGLALITMKDALLWTYERYFLQGKQQISGDWQLKCLGKDAPVEYWIAYNLLDNDRIGINPWDISVDSAHRYQRAFSKKNLVLFHLSSDLVDKVFKGAKRPLAKAVPVIVHIKELARSGVSQKIAELRAKLLHEQASGIIISAPDEVAWLYNIEVPDGPMVPSYAIITSHDAFFYVDKSSVTDRVQNFMTGNGIDIREVDMIQSDVTLLASGQLKGSATDSGSQRTKDNDVVHSKIWIDPNSCCLALSSKLNADNILMRQSPLVFADAMEIVQTDTSWTYRGQTNCYKRKILSEVVGQVEGTKTCAFHASTAALEAILRLQGRNIGKLSVCFLRKLYQARIQERTQYGKLELVCKILQDTGVIEESNIGTPLEHAEKFGISKYIVFNPKDEDSLVQAVDHMKNVGPLIASYYQNSRWYEHMRSTAILADDPSDRVFDLWKKQFASHAVCIPGFGAEAVSYFEFQDSGGVKLHKEGFGRILPSSLHELISFEVSDQANKRSRR